MAKMKRLSEELEEEINHSLEQTVNGWADLVVWEETPFRATDDVILLSYGFKYTSSNNGMERVMEDGTTWYVNINRTVPIWYKNGRKLKSSMSYERVLELFKNDDRR